MKVGVSLSGGGVRATVFHLGVLQRLAESGRWDDIIHLSTVSGGSLCVALIFAKSAGSWPDAERYLGEILDLCKKQLTEHSLVSATFCAGMIRPHLLAGGRAHLVGRVLRDQWGLDMSLKDLPDIPRWTINSTTYETGKNWRFSKKRMGDYLTGYVMNPDFPLADAAASSAGFPAGIGPLKIKTKTWNWVNYKSGSQSETELTEPICKHYHLWDGGVYENLGSEALCKPGKGLRNDIDFYIASDAGKPLTTEIGRWQLSFPPYRPPLRLLNCAMDQVNAVRTRALFGFLRGDSQVKGVFLQLGLGRSEIFNQAGCVQEGRCWQKTALSSAHVKAALEFPTTLRQLKPEEFDLLLRHGHEVADATLTSWTAETFDSPPNH